MMGWCGGGAVIRRAELSQLWLGCGAGHEFGTIKLLSHKVIGLLLFFASIR